MTCISAMVNALQHDITETATAHDRSSGFCRRASKLDATNFCRALIPGWLERPKASLSGPSQMLATCGVPMSPQGLEQRPNIHSRRRIGRSRGRVPR